MELLDITLTCLQRRNRAAFVGCAEVERALLPGEKVVLRDGDGEFYAGTVVDEIGERYLVNVGVRLPEEIALRRLGVPVAGGDGFDDLLELLGEARALVNPRPVPAQRGA